MLHMFLTFKKIILTETKRMTSEVISDVRNRKYAGSCGREAMQQDRDHCGSRGTKNLGGKNTTVKGQKPYRTF